MTAEEYRVLYGFICGRHNCIDCPLNKYIPCNKVTPEREILFYARCELKTRADRKVANIIAKLSKGVVV